LQRDRGGREIGGGQFKPSAEGRKETFEPNQGENLKADSEQNYLKDDGPTFAAVGLCREGSLHGR